MLNEWQIWKIKNCVCLKVYILTIERYRNHGGKHFNSNFNGYTQRIPSTFNDKIWDYIYSSI